MVAGLRLGILVDTLLKQQYLTTMIVQSGHRICYRGLISVAINELPEINTAIDVWIIDAAEGAGEETGQEADDKDKETGEETGESAARKANDEREPGGRIAEAPAITAIDYLLEHVTVPVILSDSSDQKPGSESHSAWLKRMTQRLHRLSGDINLQQANRASRLWVLAASTGGPAAVKDFLHYVPSGLGLAFLYVQHIDTNYAATLIKMMGGAGQYNAELASHGTVLQQDTLALVTAERRVDVMENGTLSVTAETWGGCYAPSVDQIAANVARVYRERSGLIIFSGMGDDGAASSRLIKQQGGQVWVQTPSSCASSSMPDAALAAGGVSFSGTSEELAHQLTRYMNQHTLSRTALS
jgi:chemosensory pili system protein ChpB (putative protein-glutamate methylesterase)